MEEEYGFGLIPSPPDIRDYTLLAGAGEDIDLPETFINTPTRIKYQGSKQTCVAHSLASLIEFHNLQETNYYCQFSTDFIYGCRTTLEYFGEGMFLRDGLKVIQKFGDVEYSVLPGNSTVGEAMEKVTSNFEELQLKAYPYRVSAYYKINSLDELKYALYVDGPVPGAMKYYKNSKVASDGRYIYNKNDSYSNHAVLIVGWTKDSFIVQNSWGATWGKKGYFYIPFEDMKFLFYEYYGVTDNINEVHIPNDAIKKLSPFINILLKFYQLLIKWWNGSVDSVRKI